jgi:hypothetical protein
MWLKSLLIVIFTIGVSLQANGATTSCKSLAFLGLNLEKFRIIVPFVYLGYCRAIDYMFIKFYMPIFYHIKHIHIVVMLKFDLPLSPYLVNIDE